MGSIPGSGRSWRRAWQPTPLFSPGEPHVVVVQSLSHVPSFATAWTAARQAILSFIISRRLFRFMSIESVMLSNHLPSVFPSIRVFSNELTFHIRWPKYWSFSISPSNEYSGLIAFKIDKFDLLAVQGTLKSLLQHHNLKASFLWHSAFFMVQFSVPLRSLIPET